MSKAFLGPGHTAFLDRDGTINESPPEGDYLSDPDRVRLLPGAAEAIRLLNGLDIRVVVVTNQRGIALGTMSEDDLAEVNGRLSDLLSAERAAVDAILHCPHGIDACDCRKPNPGMFQRAAQEVTGVRLEGAAMIGDSALDVDAGLRLGLTTVRIGRTAQDEPLPDYEAESLLDAVRTLTST